MAGKNILVIGGSGFLGARLCRLLAGEGHQVTAFSRGVLPLLPEEQAAGIRIWRGSILDEKALREAVAGAQVIFHYAAVSTVKGACQNAAACLDTNVTGTENLARVISSLNHSLEKIILASSISVYGEGVYICGQCGPVRPRLRLPGPALNNYEPDCPFCGRALEPHVTTEEAERNGESVYAESKKAQEDILSKLAADTNIPLAVLRYATVYGPGQPDASPYTSFLRQLAKGQSVTLTEDGRQTRDFLYVDDALKINLKLLKQGWCGSRILNIGSNKPLPLATFVELLRREFACQTGQIIPPVSYSGEILPGDVRHCNIDCSLLDAYKLTGEAVSLERGLSIKVRAFLDLLKTGEPEQAAL